jgi:hypothetical protein
VSMQFGLFDVSPIDPVRRQTLDFRPANMRTVHGIRSDVTNYDGSYREDRAHSVSVALCVEETLLDGQFVRISGGGMDAPEDLPLGSVKAMFDCDGRTRTGICQRTYKRRG